MNSPVENLVRSLYRLGLVQRELGRHALAELGSQGFLALGVVKNQGPLRVSAVAEALSIDLSVASRQVSALERAGHVGREPDPDDGRAYRLSITASGREALAASHRRLVAAFEDALDGWSDAETEALATALVRLREDARRAIRPATEAPA